MGRAGRRENSGHRRSIFFLTPFMELIRTRRIGTTNHFDEIVFGNQTKRHTSTLAVAEFDRTQPCSARAATQTSQLCARARPASTRCAAGGHPCFLLEALALADARRARSLWALAIPGNQFLVGSVLPRRFTSVYAVLRTLVREHL